jgi:PHD/YefM family antitoxin component YafN of YafNO toxin-antitoxin module
MLIPTDQNIKTITDLREKTNAFIADVKKNEEPTLVFKGNKPQFAAINLSYLKKLYDILEDFEDAALASELISEAEPGGESLEKVAKDLDIKLKKLKKEAKKCIN